VGPAGIIEMSDITNLRQLCEEHGEDVTVQLHCGPEFRFRQLPFYSRHILLHKGTTLWPSGTLLAHFVAARLSTWLQGKQTVELGCGIAALPSLAADHAGATVTITDMPEVVGLAHSNTLVNECAVEAVSLDWHCRCKTGLGPFEVLLAADVLYEPLSHRALACTLEALAAERAVALICSPIRLTTHLFYANALPEVGWAWRVLDLRDLMEEMGSTTQFSMYEIIACWRVADGQPQLRDLDTNLLQNEPPGDTYQLWDFVASKDKPRECTSDTSGEPPLAPPEDDGIDSDDEPCFAPPED